MKIIKLEDRIVLDAEIPDLDSVLPDHVENSPVSDVIQTVEDIESTGLNLSLVADDIPEVEKVVTGLKNQGEEVLLIDAKKESVQEILKKIEPILDQRNVTRVDNMSIFSHGEQGTFALGKERIHEGNIEALAPLKKWFHDDSRMKIYACDTGAGESGDHLISAISKVISANVYASDDISGEGGDWVLEKSSTLTGVQPQVNALMKTLNALSIKGHLASPVDVGVDPKTWFRGSSLEGSHADGESVTTANPWTNEGSLGGTTSMYDGTYTPTFDDSDAILNSNPVVKFELGAKTDFVNTNGLFDHQTDFTLFVALYSTDPASATRQDILNVTYGGNHFFYRIENSQFLLNIKTSLGLKQPNTNSTPAISANTATVGAINALEGSNILMFNNDKYMKMDMPGTFMQNNTSNALGSIGAFGAAKGLDGAIAEIIFFHEALDPVKYAKVENYLFDKYGLSGDKYAYDDGDNAANPFSKDDIFGLGELTGRTEVSSSTSGILTMDNPSSLEINDFLLASHDNESQSGWSQIGSSNNYRLARDWRVDETGDVGTVDLTFDVSATLPDVAFDRYVLLRDGDGDFSNATTLDASSVIGNNVKFSGVDLADGEYFSLGYVISEDPVISNFDTSNLTTDTENGAKIIDDDVTVSDVDSTDFEDGQVSVTLAGVVGTDSLYYDIPTSNTGGLWRDGSAIKDAGNNTIGTIDGDDDGNGDDIVVDLTANATPGNVQSLLQTLTFKNSDDTPVTTARNLEVTLKDGGGGETSVSRTIQIIAEDDAPVLTNNGLSINEDATKIITTAELTATDADTGDSSLVFTVKDLPDNGTLKINGSTAAIDSTFTKQDIIDNKITYEHNGTETTTDSFDVTLKDDTSTLTQSTFNITVTTSNDSPVLTNNGVTSGLNEGGSVNIAASHLSTSDEEQSASQIEYTVKDLPDHGVIKNGAATLALNDTFTQQDIMDGKVSYTHDGTETTSDGFDFTVSDGTNTLAQTTFNLTIDAVNDSPEIDQFTTTALNANEDENTPIDTDVLVTDAEGNFNGGSLEVSLASMVSTDTVFVDASLDDGGSDDVQVTGSNVIVDGVTIGIIDGTKDGSGNALLIDFNTNANASRIQKFMRQISYANSDDTPVTTSRTLTYELKDGGAASVMVSRDLTIVAQNDAPVIANNSNTSLNEAAQVTISNTDLKVTDPDNDATQITYSLTDLPDRGTLKLVNTTLSLSDTFTQDDIDNDRLHYTHDGSETTTDTFSFTVSDGNGGSIASTSHSLTINPLNDDPVLIPSGSALTFNEGDAAQQIDIAFAVSDADSSDLNGGVLTVSVDSALSTEQLGFSDGGGLTLDGNAIKSGTTTIATLTGGSGGADLQITFNASSTPSLVQSVTRQVHYQNTADDIQTTSKNIRFSLTDGDGGTSATSSVTLNVNGLNDDPVISASVASIDFLENDPARVVDSSITVSDADLLNFDSGKLTYHLVSSDSSDRLSVEAGDGIAVSGNTISQGSTAIATFTGGNGSTDLVITFNTSADSDEVQAVARRVHYQNVADDLSTGTKTLQISLTDGDGGSSSTISLNVNLTSQNDSPVLTPSVSDINYSEGDGVKIIDGNLSVADADQLDFSGGVLTFSFTDSKSGDTFQVTSGSGISVDGSQIKEGTTLIGTLTGGTSGSDLALTFNTSATAASVQAVARQVGYVNSLEDLEEGQRSIQITLTDGDGGTSSTASVNIDVSAVNDAPVVSTNSTLKLNEGATSTVTSSSLSASDVDHNSTELVYTLKEIPDHGSLLLNGSDLSNGQTFSQDDINNNRLTYSHDGSETTSDSFSFELKDGDGAVLPESEFLISVQAQNDAPALIANTGLVLDEGGRAIIDETQLKLTDPDHANSDLAITLVSLPANGELLLNGTALKPGDSFTQQDVDNHLLSYAHDGSETTSDSFDFTFSDGASATSATETFNISVNAINDFPRLGIINTISVAEGGIIRISDLDLSVDDSDSASNEIVFSLVEQPVGGDVLLSGIKLNAGDTFTQADIQNGLLSYQHWGGEDSLDQIKLEVHDSAGGSLAQFRLPVDVNNSNDVPVVVIGDKLQIDVESSEVLSTDHIDVIDPDSNDSSLNFFVESFSNVSVELNGRTLSPLESFSLADIKARNVVINHFGDPVKGAGLNLALVDGSHVEKINLSMDVIDHGAANALLLLDEPVIETANPLIEIGSLANVNPSSIGIGVRGLGGAIQLLNDTITIGHEEVSPGVRETTVEDGPNIDFTDRLNYLLDTSEENSGLKDRDAGFDPERQQNELRFANSGDPEGYFTNARVNDLAGGFDGFVDGASFIDKRMSESRFANVQELRLFIAQGGLQDMGQEFVPELSKDSLNLYVSEGRFAGSDGTQNQISSSLFDILGRDFFGDDDEEELFNEDEGPR